MLIITVQVDGMMCGMCEAHVNDAVRKAFPVKKVTSGAQIGHQVRQFLLTAKGAQAALTVEDGVFLRILGIW